MLLQIQKLEMIKDLTQPWQATHYCTLTGEHVRKLTEAIVVDINIEEPAVIFDTETGETCVTSLTHFRSSQYKEIVRGADDEIDLQGNEEAANSGG